MECAGIEVKDANKWTVNEICWNNSRFLFVLLSRELGAMGWAKGVNLRVFRWIQLQLWKQSSEICISKFYFDDEISDWVQFYFNIFVQISKIN